MKEIPKKDHTGFPKSKSSVLEISEYVILISLILYYGKALFIPLSFSMLISFMLYPVCVWLEKKGISKSISILISIFAIGAFFAALFYLLFMQALAFSNDWQSLSLKIAETTNQFSNYIVEHFDISEAKQSDFLKNLINNSGFQALKIAQDTLYSFSESIFFLLIIPVYSSLILYHRKLLVNVLYQIFPPNKKNTIYEILIETIHSFYNFIKGMLVVYLIVGILNSIGLAIIGIPYPILFGFMASILTFIPYVGILFSSILPITVSWITYNSIWYPMGIIAVFSIVQLLEAYLIFPFVVGNQLKINTLAILITIVIGGILWGAIGMILFIPFISILKLIADRVESLKIISLLLDDGNLNKNNI